MSELTGRSAGGESKIATKSPTQMSPFAKSAPILFILVAASIGGLVMLYLKFRNMDKQVRKLTKEVADAPSEQDLKDLQESWALEFHKTQAGLYGALSTKLEAIQVQLSAIVPSAPRAVEEEDEGDLDSMPDLSPPAEQEAPEMLPPAEAAEATEVSEVSEPAKVEDLEEEEEEEEAEIDEELGDADDDGMESSMDLDADSSFE